MNTLHPEGPGQWLKVGVGLQSLGLRTSQEEHLQDTFLSYNFRSPSQARADGVPHNLFPLSTGHTSSSLGQIEPGMTPKAGLRPRGHLFWESAIVFGREPI